MHLKSIKSSADEQVLVHTILEYRARISVFLRPLMHIDLQ